MSNSIKIPKDSVSIKEKDTIKVNSSSNVAIQVENAFKVKANPRTYQIVSEDVATIKRNSDPDQWFLDIVNNTINTSNLADDVSDLDNRFGNFSNGTTLQIGYLQNQDLQLAYDISVLKTSNDTNTAAISTLETTKVTENEARAVSESTIAAWTNNGSGGAWFNDQVSAISTTAYSAAKSASTLTATMNSQQDQLAAIAGDITILQKQVDGVVETWFDTHDIVAVNGDINLTAEPYATWVTEDTKAIHSGDSYVKYELDANGNKNYISSYRFTKTAIEEPYTDADGYAWVAVSDSRAEEAYQAALAAQATADGKIVTYYQTFAPTNASNGDLWLDSDDNNKMYRHNGTDWVVVDDQRISAAVTKIDEVAVDTVNGPRAKSSLVVGVGGSISGYVAEATGEESSFKIFADRFSVANDLGTSAGEPFRIENGYIYFNGKVTFDNIDGDTDFVTKAALATDDGTTIINGGNIRTGHISADIINGGVIYNLGANANTYTFKIDLNNGFIHIR